MFYYCASEKKKKTHKCVINGFCGGDIFRIKLYMSNILRLNKVISE